MKIFNAIIAFMVTLVCSSFAQESGGTTTVSIIGEKFYINNTPTYSGHTWNGYSLEGLLFNSRMVQGIFDDLNPSSRDQWKYPDTGKWDPERNTNEFVSAMESWYQNGLTAITLNLQGGSPTGYGNKEWINSAFDRYGNLQKEYFNRLEKILNKADQLHMVVILGLFYFGQDQVIKSEAGVLNAVDKTMQWLFEKNYKNILIEINNECDIESYDHSILKSEKISELILHVKQMYKNDFSFLVGTSFKGGAIPTNDVIQNSDFILVHGNGVTDPRLISDMLAKIRKMESYTAKPILFNEDDHYNFDKEENNFTAAIKSFASWGFFDFRRQGESYEEGFQSVPVDWKINSKRKKDFFKLLQNITQNKKVK